MSKKITVEFYELLLKTRNKRQTSGKSLPPIDYVNILSAFRLLESESNIIGRTYPYGNDDFYTSLEHIEINESWIDLVIGFYDRTAAHRTVKHVENGSESVQKRADDEAVKYFCHCVMRVSDNPSIAQIGIERLTGCPASRVNKTLKSIFKALEQAQPNSEGVFQVTNPDGARNNDGTDDIQSFILVPQIHAMCSEYMRDAISNGRFKGLNLTGINSNLDDPNNILTILKADLKFKVQPIGPNQEPLGYLQSAIESARRNSQHLSDRRTFAVIENEDTGKEQSVELTTGNELNSAFVLRKEFDASAGRIHQSDNTNINEVFLSEIRRIFV